MARPKTSSPVRSAGLRRTWETALGKAQHGRERTIFGDEAFTYDPLHNIYRCPAGQTLKPRRMHPIRRTIEYKAPARVCVRSVFCVLNALAPTMDAPCSGTKNKLS